VNARTLLAALRSTGSAKLAAESLGLTYAQLRAELAAKALEPHAREILERARRSAERARLLRRIEARERIRDAAPEGSRRREAHTEELERLRGLLR
jgi:molybdenum-dependent DNA-binding transcriptional regulator ModE